MNTFLKRSATLILALNLGFVHINVMPINARRNMRGIPMLDEITHNALMLMPIIEPLLQ